MSYQYRDSHVKDKTVSRPSYLWYGNPHTWERWSLYWDGALVAKHMSFYKYGYIVRYQITGFIIPKPHFYYLFNLTYVCTRWKQWCMVVRYDQPNIPREVSGPCVDFLHTVSLIARFMGSIWGRQDPGVPHVWPHEPCDLGCVSCHINLKTGFTQEM